MYEKSKAQINMDPEAHEIRAAKEAYQNITNVSVSTHLSFYNHQRGNKLNSTELFLCYLQLTYKKKYEATKNKWIWTADRPDFLNAAKNSLQQSDVSCCSNRRRVFVRL